MPGSLWQKMNFSSPKAFIDFVDYHLLEHSFCQLSEHLGCSASHLRAELKHIGWQGVYKLHSSNEILQELKRLGMQEDSNITWGLEMAMAQLLKAGIRTRKKNTHAALRLLDPVMMELRHKTTIHRRVYSVTRPLLLYHTDSYCKLEPWGIYVHAIIDGGTSYIVALRVETSKNARLLYDMYAEAVQKYGRPSLMRSDNAGEFNLIEEDMNSYWHNRAGPSFLRGPSVHNHRIERLWRDLHEKVSWFWIEFIYRLHDSGMLDKRKVVQMHSLYKTIFVKFKQEVENWKGVWDLHKMRAQSKGHHPRSARRPFSSFKHVEREMGLIPCPTSNVIARPSLHAEPTPDGLQLPQELEAVRDMVYDRFCNQEASWEAKYSLHVDLTLECVVMNAAGRTLQEHARLLENSDSDGRKLAVQKLLSGLQTIP